MDVRAGTVRVDDIHPECLGALCDLHSDAAKSDKSQCLAAQLYALVRFLFPLSLAHGDIRDIQETGDCQHVRNRQFCDGSARCVRGIRNGQSLAAGIIDIDVVHADTAADNHLQPTCRHCLIDDRLAYLCCGADEQHIDIRECLPQLIRLIVLLQNLISTFLQLADCRGIQPVCCQYSYHRITLLFSVHRSAVSFCQGHALPDFPFFPASTIADRSCINNYFSGRQEGTIAKQGYNIVI